MTEAARSRRDDARHAPQDGERDGVADPLAELARLVGQDDPFRRVFRAQPSPESFAPPLHDGWPDEQEAEHDRHPQRGYAPYEAHAFDERAGDDAGHEADRHLDRADGAHPRAVYGAHDHRGGYVPRGDEAGLAEEHFADEGAAVALPDMWAQGDARPLDPPPAALEATPREGSSARRPLAVLAAVLVLTGGGLAASFLAKGQGAAAPAVASSGRTAPTIMAAAGPTKVKVEDAGATAPEDRDAALLNKNAAPSSGAVKIVSSQEQPADLSQLPKTADLAAGARPLPPAAPSPFPEPKKVKTFVVHPDGSMLSGDGAPPTAPDAAQPSSPRAEARGSATTPRPTATPATVASLAADPAPPTAPAAARQPAAPGVRAAVAKPNDTADAPGAAGGSFGLQLASSPAEADAQAAFARLKKKFPALLGSLSATIHRAETGDKPVYRVRVGGMSQDEARALCTKLQGAGGSCFVVHN